MRNIRNLSKKSFLVLLTAAAVLSGCGGGGGGSSGNGSAGQSSGETGGGVSTNPVSPTPAPSVAPLSVAIGDFGAVIPQNQVANALVTFDGAITDPTKTSQSYRWDFGDGSTAPDSRVEHQFPQGGTYQVSLTATDTGGATGTKAISWKVANASIRYLAGAISGPSYANGSTTEARFANPTGVAVARDGSIYVIEGNSTAVRKIAPDGITSTLAGTNILGGQVDGMGANARFARLTGIAVDASGNVYVVDNNLVRKITPAGQVTTVVNTSPSGQSGDGGAIAIDSNGDIFVTGNASILKITNGQVSTLVGRAGEIQSVDGNATVARFKYLKGIAVDRDNNIYVGEGCSGVRKVTPDGTTSTLRADPPNSANEPCTTGGMAADADRRLFLTRDYDILTLDRFGNPGQIASTLNGTSVFVYLRGIATTPTGDVVVTDQTNTIRKITPNGGVSTVTGTPDDVDTSSLGNIGSGRLAKLSDGTVLMASHSCVQVLRLGSAPSTFAGDCINGGSSNGSASSARFFGLTGIAVDSQDNVFVSDGGTKTIRQIAPNGTVSTYAGIAGTYGTSDGPRTSALFRNPGSLAFDSANNLWVTDEEAIRQITVAGEVKTIPVTLTCTGLSGPTPCTISNIVADRAGNVFVSATTNGSAPKVYKITAAGQASLYFTVSGAFPFASSVGLATDPQGDVWAMYTTGQSAVLQHLNAAGEPTSTTAFKRFKTKVDANGPDITFDRTAIGPAVFSANGTLTTISRGTAFQLTGLQ